MKRWGAVALAVAVLGLMVAAENNGGCQYFNRMGISPDGNTVAFSLNGEGGFAVDDTSAVYTLDITTCRMRRVSGDKTMATCADIDAEGNVLFNWRYGGAGESLEVAAATADGEVVEVTRNWDVDWVAQWLDDERILLARSATLDEEGDDEKDSEVVLAIIAEDGQRRDLVKDLYSPSKKRFYWSTLPVWSGNVLAYAALDTKKPEDRTPTPLATDEVAEEDRGYAHIYLVNLGDGKRRELAVFAGGFEVAGEEGEDLAGYVDLAFSADGRKLAACFLPSDFAEDQQRSWLYLIDVGTRETKLVRDDVNMYYPRFAPHAEGEPYRLLYLSGTGEQGKGRGLHILNLTTGESWEVISLPGKIMTAYTDWRWLSELEGAEEDTPKGRLRVYHLSDLGLIIAEVNEDGSDLSVRYLDGPKLRLAQVEADVRWAATVAEEKAEALTDSKEALAEAKKLASGPVEFVTVPAVPRRPQESEEE